MTDPNPDHELNPVPGCTCIWCDEEGDNQALLHLDGTGAETVRLPWKDIVVVRSKFCPECGAKIDDPDGCWKCDFEFPSAKDQLH